MQLIPAIDLRDGRCVRLFQGDYARETVYDDDPLAVARRFVELGFRYLHVVDLDGARSGRQQHQAIVARILAETGLAVQLGGGIRDREAVAGWLDTGVQRVVIGSTAVERPAEVSAWLREFGAERIVLALDCRVDADGVPRVATHGWEKQSDLSLWDCLDAYASAPLRHVLCTDVARDGALAGPAIELYRDFNRRLPALSLQASGGIRNAADLRELRDLGAAGAITGRALLDGRLAVEEIRPFLPAA